VLHDSMPHDPIQGQGQGRGSPKVAKMADFTIFMFFGEEVVPNTNVVLPRSCNCPNSSMNLT